MTQGAEKKGLHHKIKLIWFLNYIVDFFYYFMHVINGFYPLLGDFEPYLSPNFGRKLGMDNQLQIYINKACLRPWIIVKEELF